jgi:hypothetical protein
MTVNRRRASKNLASGNFQRRLISDLGGVRKRPGGQSVIAAGGTFFFNESSGAARHQEPGFGLCVTDIQLSGKLTVTVSIVVSA